MKIVSIAAATAFLLLALVAPASVSAACLGSPPSLTAQTWDDIPACHTLATNGTTITVLAGSYTTTTSGVTITKYVKIIAAGNVANPGPGAGAGTTTVTVTDNSPGGDPGVGGCGCPTVLTIVESTAGSTRLSGFRFVLSNPHLGASALIQLNVTTGGKPILLSNNVFTLGSSGNSIIANTNRGVIWDNTFTATPQGSSCLTNASAVRHKPESNGDSWLTPSKWGTDDTNGDANLYFEHNLIKWVGETLDCDDNCRIVIRYNEIWNTGPGTHGDTSWIGGRSMEIYRNTFVNDASTIHAGCTPPAPSNYNNFMSWRGGTGLVHHNVIPPVNNGWGAKNGVVFAGWLLRRADALYGCWVGTGSIGNSSYPMEHQVGWGWTTGATQAGATGIFQDIEPVYLWSNTGGGDYSGPSIQNYDCGSANVCSVCASRNDVSTMIQVGREILLDTAKPGYAEYTYPHPLTSLVDSPSPPSGIIVAQQLAPSPAFAPIPASGLIMSSSASVTAVNTASEVSMFQFLIGPGLTATSSSQGAVVSPTYTGASSSGMTTPVLWTAPAPLHFRAIGLLAGGAGTSLAIGVNLNDGIAPPSSGGGTATVNLNNSIIAAISGPGTLARLDVYVVPLATRTAPPNSANNAFLASRFSYVNASGSETVVNSSVVAGVNFASPTRLNVLARWSSADSGSSLTFFNRMLKVVE